MVFPILGANTAAPGDLVQNSLRISPVDDGFLARSTSGVSDSNTRTFTLSMWVKKTVNVEQHLYGFRVDSDNMSYLRFNSDNRLRFAAEATGGAVYRVETNAQFRDPSAWYHVVVAVDTTQGTAGNRVKLYVNGTQHTSLNSTDYPAQNFDVAINQEEDMIVGAMRNSNGTTTGQVDGYISETHFVDGAASAPTVFAETDSNGFWIPKDCKDDITYGTRGFHLQYKQVGTGTASASTIGADTSGNGNHFTSNNLVAVDITTDNPMNNFSTGNPLILIAGGNITPSFSEGMVKWTAGSNGSYGSSGHGNMAVTNGKWYWEMKIDSGRNNGVTCGIAPVSVFESNYGTSTSTDYTFARDNLGSFGYQHTNSGSKKVTGTAAENADDYGSPGWSVDDIIGVAMDLDNDTLTFYLNGTSQGQAFSSLPDVYYTPAWYGYSSTVWEFNAGNPYNALSSGNKDGNGHGNFEFAVPSGFYSLNTKNLAEFG